MRRRYTKVILRVSNTVILSALAVCMCAPVILTLFASFKSGQELTDIYNTADIAVSSLGMHRIGLTSGQTLKSKEYGAKGLPVISEYDVTEYPKGNQYQLIVPMDESPLDMDKIIEMYDLIEASEPQKIRARIRAKVQKQSDIKVVMRPVAEFFGD